MNTVILLNMDSGRRIKADIISQSMRTIRVVPQGASTPITLLRPDERSPYFTELAGMKLQTLQAPHWRAAQ